MRKFLLRGLAKLVRLVIRLTLWALWLLALAGIYVSSFGILQTLLAAVIRGDFAITSQPVYVLSHHVEPTEILGLSLPGFGVLVLGFVMSLALAFGFRRGARLSRRRELVPLRAAFGIVILLVVSYSLIGLIKSDVNLNRLLQGDFNGVAAQGTLAGISFLPPIWLWHLLFVSLFGGLIYFTMVYNVHARHAGRAWRDRQSLEVSVSPVLRALARGRPITRAQRRLFLGMINTPSAYIERIKEVPETTQRSTVVTTRYTLRVGAVNKRSRYVFPLFPAARGRLEDGLRVHRDGEEPVSTLAHVDAVAYVAGVIRALMADAGGGALSAYTRNLEHGAIAYLLSLNDMDDRPYRDRVQQYGAFARFAATLMSLPHRHQSPLYEAVKLFAELLRSNPVIVELSGEDFERTRRGGVVRLTTVRRVIAPQSEVRFGDLVRFLLPGRRPSVGLVAVVVGIRRLWRVLGLAADRVVGGMRHVAGVGSNVIRHPLSNAARTPSYHLELKGPDNTYMARQAIDLRPGFAVDPTPHAFSTRSAGQRHTHLYVRNAPAAFKSMRYSATFFERTPGSLAVAFIAASSSLVVSLVLAIQQMTAIRAATPKVLDGRDVSHWQIAATLPDQSGLLQVLLAFPIVTVLSGMLIAGRNPWGGLLSARIANLATVLLSLAALWISSLPASFDHLALPRVWVFVLGCLAVIAVGCLGGWTMRALVHSRYIDGLRERP